MPFYFCILMWCKKPIWNPRMPNNWREASLTCSQLWQLSSTVLLSWSLGGSLSQLECFQELDAMGQFLPLRSDGLRGFKIKKGKQLPKPEGFLRAIRGIFLELWTHELCEVTPVASRNAHGERLRGAMESELRNVSSCLSEIHTCHVTFLLGSLPGISMPSG